MNKVENKRGFTKQNIKKLFSIDKGDLFWIVFFICLFAIAFAYKAETETCRRMAENDCYGKCLMEQGIDEIIAGLKEKYGDDVQVKCYPELGTCELFGVAGRQLDFGNLTIVIDEE